jgi:hypothetical protein
MLNADDSHGSFCFSGTINEYGYHVLFVACGARSVKSDASRFEARDKMSAAFAPRPCIITRALFETFNSFPTLTIFLVCIYLNFSRFRFITGNDFSS